MAISNGTFNVTTTAQAITGSGGGSARSAAEVTIDNSSASEVVVGGPGVTTANGIRIAAGTKERFISRGNDPLHIIGGSAVTVRYMIAPLNI